MLRVACELYATVILLLWAIVSALFFILFFIFRGAYRLPGTGIVECSKIIFFVVSRLYPVTISQFFLHCALAAAQCIAIGPVCVCVCVWVCGWICYQDNSKLRASILTKLGLWVKVVTVSS